MCFRCYVSQVILKKKLEGNRSEKTFTKRSNCKAKKYVPRIRFLLVQIVKIIHLRPLLVKLDLIAHLLLTKKCPLYSYCCQLCYLTYYMLTITVNVPSHEAGIPLQTPSEVQRLRFDPFSRNPLSQLNSTM